MVAGLGWHVRTRLHLSAALMAVDGRRLLADELEFSVLNAAGDISTEFILPESTHFSAVLPSKEHGLDYAKC